MAGQETKGPTIYVLRRELDSARPVVMKFEYGRGKRQVTKTVPFTRSWVQALALPKGIEACHVPDGIPLWVKTSPMLAPQGGLDLVRVVMVVPARATFEALAELAVLSIEAESAGVEVQFLDPKTCQPLPFGWCELAQVCLSYAGSGLPDEVAAELIWQDLLREDVEEK